MRDSAQSVPTRTVRNLVVPVLERLLPRSGIVGEHQRSFWVLFELLTRESLGCAADENNPPFSGICNDGTPWQFCASLGSGHGSVRYLTEIGLPGTTLQNRITLSRERIAEVFRMLQFPSTADRVATALFALLPDHKSELAISPAGLWVGVAHGSDGSCRLRLYANNGWGDRLARWLRLIRCLAVLGGAGYGAAIRGLLPLLTDSFSPAGFAITLPDEPSLCKLYLRPIDVPWPACREVVNQVHGRAAASFLKGVEEGLGRSLETLPPNSLVLSVAAPLTGGELDVKLDFCGHCLFLSDSDARISVSRLVRIFDLHDGPYRQLLEAVGADEFEQTSPGLHAFVGIGAGPGAKVRVNVYAKPVGRRLRPNDGPVRLALERGVEALLRAAESLGRWSDFTLPVGTSTTWVTAYVANALLDVRGTLPANAVLVQTCGFAAKWILEQFRQSDGWGYNEAIETDADSTAYCTLLLLRERLEASAGIAALMSFARDDGGFGTFRRTDPNDAWGLSHSDVLPTVLRALRRTEFDRGAMQILASREDGGSWRSYWWESDLYATEANLRLLSEAGMYEECQVSLDWLLDRSISQIAFEQALCLRAMATLRLDPKQNVVREQLIQSLLESQCDDGSWRGSAALRVTNPSCPRPWEAPEASGRLYLDRGILTTATVVSALAQVANVS